MTVPHRVQVAFIAAVFAVLAQACMRADPPTAQTVQTAQSAETAKPPPQAKPGQGPLETYTGTLKSGYVGVGGEHTGWMLITSPEGAGIEIDVHQVLTQAKELDGKRAVVSGRMTEKKYVERGVVKVLVAESVTAQGS